MILILYIWQDYFLWNKNFNRQVQPRMQSILGGNKKRKSENQAFCPNRTLKSGSSTLNQNTNPLYCIFFIHIRP